MEKKGVTGCSSAFKETGDFLVIINSSCVDWDERSSIIFAENLSLDASISLAMNLHRIAIPESIIYVVHKDSLHIYSTSYVIILGNFNSAD